jgi:hypothetical protein
MPTAPLGPMPPSGCRAKRTSVSVETRTSHLRFSSSRSVGKKRHGRRNESAPHGSTELNCARTGRHTGRLTDLAPPSARRPISVATRQRANGAGNRAAGAAPIPGARTRSAAGSLAGRSPNSVPRTGRGRRRPPRWGWPQEPADPAARGRSAPRGRRRSRPTRPGPARTVVTSALRNAFSNPWKRTRRGRRGGRLGCVTTSWTVPRARSRRGPGAAAGRRYRHRPHR